MTGVELQAVPGEETGKPGVAAPVVAQLEVVSDHVNNLSTTEVQVRERKALDNG